MKSGKQKKKKGLGSICMQNVVHLAHKPHSSSPPMGINQVKTIGELI